MHNTQSKFILSVNRAGRKSAGNVRLLREEADTDTLARALDHSDPSFFQPSFERMKELSLPAKSVKKIAKVLERRILTASLFGSVTAAIRTLPHPILLESAALRQCLPPADHLEFCLKYLRAATSDSLLPEVLELARNTPTSDTKFWSKLPSVCSEHAADVRQKLPVFLRAGFLIKKIRGTSDPEEVIALERELQECLHSCEDPRVWRLIGDDLLFSVQLWKVAPRSIRLNAIVSGVLKPEHLERCPDVMVFVSEELSGPSEHSRCIWERLPPFLKRKPEVFPLMPPEEQVDCVWPLSPREEVSVWQMLSEDAKLLYLYRAAKAKAEAPIVISLAWNGRDRSGSLSAS
jgi:hypothetical protein